MKKIQSFLLLICLLIATDSKSATYKGRDVDGEKYPCRAKSTSIGNWYKLKVLFDGDKARLYFPNGGYITVRLYSEEIENLEEIEARNVANGDQWIIDVSDSIESED